MEGRGKAQSEEEEGEAMSRRKKILGGVFVAIVFVVSMDAALFVEYWPLGNPWVRGVFAIAVIGVIWGLTAESIRRDKAKGGK